MKSNYFLWQDERLDINTMFACGKTRYIKSFKWLVDKYYEDGVRRTDVYRLKSLRGVCPNLIVYKVIELRPYKLEIDGYENLTEHDVEVMRPYDRERVVYVDEE